MPNADLDLFFENTLDIRLVDGSFIHVRKPTARLMLDVFRFERDIAVCIVEADEETATAITYGILSRALGHNTEGIAIDGPWLALNCGSAELAAITYSAYAGFLEEIAGDPALRPPSKPGEESGNGKPSEFFPQVGVVMAYAHCSYDAALDLPADVFLACVKHSAIDRLSATEEGRKYLADCDRLKQTEPDYDALSKLPGYTATKGK